MQSNIENKFKCDMLVQKSLNDINSKRAVAYIF